MSKERLKEIKEVIFKCKHGHTRGYSVARIERMATSLVEEHGEWLIDQIEGLKKESNLMHNALIGLSLRNTYSANSGMMKGYAQETLNKVRKIRYGV